ncbi:sensor histidine kinase [Streptomyces sp. KS 21]|uniref:sensor histidine kinase n=1 Tax=Streptomyces sp. KS 21 TaxID=2485150 RepID=UPI0010642C86|nr:sensor histidine kinase [Streptomyces sp. KS 21]TDU73948.1 histidine kinase/DNA gyrase B/HSP90-like ATPase [Streptomyces sp. KS 21]
MPIRSEGRTGEADEGAAGTAGDFGGTGRGKASRPVFDWTRNDALVAIGAAVNDLIGFSLGAADDGRPVTVPALVLVVLAAPFLLARRARPVTVLCAVLALGAALNLTTPQGPHFSAAYMVALYTVTRLRSPAVTAAAAVATVPVTMISGGYGDSSVLTGLLGNTVAVVLVVGAGLVVRRWQEEADAKRTLLADRAVAEERRRIARELHDIVAHHITTMQLMAGGARANLAHDPGAAREALVTLEESGRMALREMRQLLDVLRAGEEPEQVPPAPQPGTGDLGRIISESRLAGTPTEFTVRGTARPLPPTVGLTVFRIVQEALTNARKHAVGARAHVRLTYGPDGVDVEVRDDGARAGRPAASRPGAGNGYGLIGMRERVALQGGTLETGSCDGGGFRVAARLPAGDPGGQREDRRG